MPRAEAASVVTELAAFLREPTRHRPRFTQGREVLEGGHHVFRFAQGKFPPGLLHDMPTHRREELREAADAFIRQVCFWEGATHYQVLCVAPGARREVIKENYRLLMALIHPDRSGSAAHPWPREWAQRANQAYEVLSDEAKRATYDESLRALGSIPAARSRPAGAPRGGTSGGARSTSRRKLRIAKAAVALAAVVSTLLLLEAWYGETPREYSLFEGLGRSGSGADHPRYLGSGFFHSHAAAAASIPLAANSKGAPVDARLARHEVAAPERALSRFSTQAQPLAAVAARAGEPQPEPAATIERAAAVTPPVSATRSPPMLVAHALDAQDTPASARPTSAEIENVVARLVGYYEAGEADQLMGLLASDGGYWQTARIRQAYADFFRATRQRHLRVDTLEWKTAALAAHAKGEATVQAEFFDEPRALDRKVSVELDIAVRDGEAKITRLSLYPNAP